MLKSRSLLVLLVVALGASPLWAQEATELGDIKAEIQKSIDGLKEAQDAHMKKTRSQPRSEQRAYYFANQPDATPFLTAVQKIVKANPSDEKVAGGIAFLIQRAEGKHADMGTWASKLALEHHQGDAKLMSTIIRGASGDFKPSAAETLKALAASKDFNISIPAQFAQIERLKGWAESAKRFAGLTDEKTKKQYVDFYGADVIASFAKADVTGTSKKVNEMLTALSKNPQLAEVKRGRRGTYADAVADELFIINNLAVGAKAPEINGTDVDGTAFKLSDYRGKAVLLDFWGHW